MPLINFSVPEHVPLLLSGGKLQTTRLRGKRGLKVGDVLYCYYQGRMKKGSCDNCLQRYRIKCPHQNRPKIDLGVKLEGCSEWSNYFGEAVVQKVEKLQDVFYGGISYIGIGSFNIPIISENRERWARLDGFVDFAEADKWFSNRYGVKWEDLPFVVISFDPEWELVKL